MVMSTMAPIPEAPSPGIPDPSFSVSHQKVELDIDLFSRSLKGRTELIVIPESRDLKLVRLNCRQCRISKVSVNGKASQGVVYDDPYEKVRLSYTAGVQQYEQLREKFEAQAKEPPEEELIVKLNKNVRIEEVDPFSESAQSYLHSKANGTNKEESGDISTIDFAPGLRTGFDQSSRFTPITIVIDYAIERVSHGMHFVGWEGEDLRYPHAYSTNSSSAGAACSIFPCVDDLTTRCTWEVFIKYSTTIGEALKIPAPDVSSNFSNGTFTIPRGDDGQHGLSGTELRNTFSNEDKALEISAICTGDLTDEIIDKKDPTKKTSCFTCSSPVSARHIGFAIGPFEQVDLAKFREGADDDRLGQNATPVSAFCLPGRSSDVENTCLPMAKAVDFFNATFSSYPFSEYKICFVDDIHPEIIHTSCLSLCSNRLLFPEDVIDPLHDVTRKLAHALATQYIGISIVPREPEDTWVVVGMAYYMTDVFMKKISGSNEYRFNQKRASDRVVELDVDRPSLLGMGPLVDLDPSGAEFVALKAPLVLFILDQRLKKSGQSGMSRIITKFLVNAKTGDLVDGAITYSAFMRMCERIGHAKLQNFFEQWVEGTGCPKFRVQQRFNKKKLVVEMSIHQVQAENIQQREIRPDTFVRDMREEAAEVEIEPIQPVFTGPMTIRIHEADGTPYEHIIEIKDGMTRFDVPYNTKYKRLKRTRRQKEKAMTVGAEYLVEGSDDVLLYCLGDVLQSEEEIKDWRLQDWSPDEEERMSQESYEWIRMDADFEWICKISLQMPPYMWVSQLQQDRDVVAQLETIQYLANQNGHPLISSICIRTLMDHRYFHGIRVAAADVLTRCARDETNWIGLFHLEKAFQELFCYRDSPMPRRNDFSDRALYYMQRAIPRAISRVRDNSGRATPRARSFLLDKLKFNDNSNNDFSDSHYLALLMRSLAETMATSPPSAMSDNDDDFSSEDDPQFYKVCLEEIERYRRVDEWIPSYHNILSTTALDCKKILTKAGIIPLEPRDFLQYTADSTLDLLCLSAFSNLLELGTIKQDPITRWFLFVLGNDPSPFVREHMFRILGRTLGALAIGVDPSSSTSSLSARNAANGPSENNISNNGGLIIEQEGESATAERAAFLARMQSLEGAKSALRDEISEHKPFQLALWDAIISPTLSLDEKADLLDLCELLYDPTTAYVVILKYPRYWRCKKVGKGKLTFTNDGKVRTKKMAERVWRPPPPPLPTPSGPHGHFSSSRSGHMTGLDRRTSFSLSMPQPPKEYRDQTAYIKRETSVSAVSSPGIPPHPSPSTPGPTTGRPVLKFKRSSFTGNAAAAAAAAAASAGPPSASPQFALATSSGSAIDSPLSAWAPTSTSTVNAGGTSPSAGPAIAGSGATPPPGEIDANGRPKIKLKLRLPSMSTGSGGGGGSGTTD